MVYYTNLAVSTNGRNWTAVKNGETWDSIDKLRRAARNALPPTLLELQISYTKTSGEHIVEQWTAVPGETTIRDKTFSSRTWTRVN